MHQIFLDLFRRRVAGQAKPHGQPLHVSIHHHPRGDVEGRAQHHVRGFSSSPRQRRYRVEIARNFAPVPLADKARRGLNVLGFLTVKAGRFHDVFQHLDGGFGQRLRCWKAPK